MKSKMKKLTLGISLIAAMTVLASCDDVEADLLDSDKNAVLLQTNDVTITNNKLGQIYDALVSSGTSNSEKVLNNILLKISESVFGTFWEIKDAVDNGTQSAFAEAHKDGYHRKNADGEKITDADQVTTVYEHLLERINRDFIGYTSNTTYSQDNQFFEERFYKAQKTALYDLEPVADADFKGKDVNGKDVGVQVTVSPTYAAGNGFGTTVVKKYFQENYLKVYKDYIDRQLLPELMRTLLTQRYILDDNAVALGRSAARKAQYITLNNINQHPGKVEDLFTAYAKLVLAEKEVGGVSLSAAELGAIANLYGTASNDLNFLNDLYKGFWNDTVNPLITADVISAAVKVYTAANFTKIENASDEWQTVTAGGPGVQVANEILGQLDTVYKETTYGGYLTDYAKIDVTNRFTNDSSAYSDFTGSGVHTPNVGMKQKVRSLIVSDATTEGWFQESSIGNLSSDYSGRLFKNTVANDVEALDNGDDKELTYGWQVNGSYYLTRTSYPGNIDPVPADGVEYNPSPYLLSSGDSWTIVRVDEAVKNSLMRNDNYAAKAEVEKYISYALSSNTAYTKNAKQYYVKQAALAYHDQAVYDYFEETFPDLFDD